MKRKWWFWTAGCAVLALVLADTAAWWWAERALTRGVGQWRAQMAASGIIATVGPTAEAGWPIAASQTLAGVILRSGPASISIDQARLRLSALEPDALNIALPGQVTAALPGLPTLRVTARQWTARVPASGQAAIDARDMRVQIGNGQAQPPTLTIALAHLQLSPPASAGTSLVGSAQSIGLPDVPGISLPLGPRVASVAFDLAFSHDIPPPFLTAPALGAWRDSGGTLDINRFAIGYGPLGLSGQGRFDLDAQLQPEGRAALHIVGQTETLNTLAAAHVISSHVAIAANAVLSVLAATPPGGGVPQVDTNIVVSQGIVSVAGFPLARLPVLAWPTGS